MCEIYCLLLCVTINSAWRQLPSTVDTKSQASTLCHCGETNSQQKGRGQQKAQTEKTWRLIRFPSGARDVLNTREILLAERRIQHKDVPDKTRVTCELFVDISTVCVQQEGSMSSRSQKRWFPSKCACAYSGSLTSTYVSPQSVPTNHQLP